jgi:hypothetical protein
MANVVVAEQGDGQMDQSDLLRLEEAVGLLENPDWIAHITDLIGIPIEKAFEKLPKRANEIITNATMKSIQKALKIAVSTLNGGYRGSPSNWWHRITVVASGGTGGFFGLPGLTVELPISTTIMLRSIADIARSEGEDLNNVEARLACVQVFALGGSRLANDSEGSKYFGARLVFARAITEACEFIAEKGLIEEGAPALVRLIIQIASRFEVVVSEKVAGQCIPVIGSLGGATINYLFIKHFQSVAKGHFIVRHLERKYGKETVRNKYESLASKLK